MCQKKGNAPTLSDRYDDQGAEDISMGEADKHPESSTEPANGTRDRVGRLMRDDIDVEQYVESLIESPEGGRRLREIEKRIDKLADRLPLKEEMAG